MTKFMDFAGWQRESDGRGGERRWRLYLMRAAELVPIHVTSIRNGRVAGHNCWSDHCDNSKEEFVTRMWPEQAQIGRRYMVDRWSIAVHQRPWQCSRCGGLRYESAPCRMTFHEPCGFKLGTTTARCDDGSRAPVQLPIGDDDKWPCNCGCGLTRGGHRGVR